MPAPQPANFPCPGAPTSSSAPIAHRPVAPHRAGSAASPLLLAILLALLLLLTGTACINSAGDKCFVSTERHEAAQRLYDRSGSLAQTEQTLAEAGWMPCEIEQTLYRLSKENGM